MPLSNGLSREETMPQPRIEKPALTPSDSRTALEFDDESYAEPETTPPEKDDDPAAEDDFPAPIGPMPKVG